MEQFPFAKAYCEVFNLRKHLRLPGSTCKMSLVNDTSVIAAAASGCQPGFDWELLDTHIPEDLCDGYVDIMEKHGGPDICTGIFVLIDVILHEQKRI